MMFYYYESFKTEPKCENITGKNYERAQEIVDVFTSYGLFECLIYVGI